MFKRHKHEWEKVSEEILPSFAEKFAAIARLPNMGTWVDERKQVATLRCKCGKMKRVVNAMRW